MVAREHVWDNGIRRLPRAIRNRYKSGVLFTLARLGGTANGFARAIVVPVRRGHFAPRGATTPR